MYGNKSHQTKWDVFLNRHVSRHAQSHCQLTSLPSRPSISHFHQNTASPNSEISPKFPFSTPQATCSFFRLLSQSNPHRGPILQHLHSLASQDLPQLTLCETNCQLSFHWLNTDNKLLNSPSLLQFHQFTILVTSRSFTATSTMQYRLRVHS